MNYIEIQTNSCIYSFEICLIFFLQVINKQFENIPIVNKRKKDKLKIYYVFENAFNWSWTSRHLETPNYTNALPFFFLQKCANVKYIINFIYKITGTLTRPYIIIHLRALINPILKCLTTKICVFGPISELDSPVDRAYIDRFGFGGFLVLNAAQLYTTYRLFAYWTIQLHCAGNCVLCDWAARISVKTLSCSTRAH